MSFWPRNALDVVAADVAVIVADVERAVEVVVVVPSAAVEVAVAV